MGNYKEGSDIDMALLGKGVDEGTVRKLSKLLNEDVPIPYKVDINAYSLWANEELKRHIDKWGKVLR